MLINTTKLKLQNNMDKINTILHGVVGASVVEFIPNVIDNMPTSEDIANITQAFVQIVIGIGTIYKILKPNNKKDNL